MNQAFADKPTIIARLAELAMLLDTYCTWGPDGEYFNADNGDRTERCDGALHVYPFDYGGKN
ncbi:TPA: hypothetical protein U2M09_004383 [Enterobacter hormaechei]|nr:hypothetical protein [Enterobacter hormaechei]